jgi:hypothetical protein
MDEKIVKELFEKFDNEFNKILEREVFFDGGGRIDYIATAAGKTVGIEVKGSRSEIYGSIGQLSVLKKIFSDLYLLAPLAFIKKFLRTTEGMSLLNEIGILIIAENQLHVLKRPETTHYYFKPNSDPKKPKSLQPKKLPKKHLVVNENDIKVYKHFKDKIFTVVDIMSEFRLTRAMAYIRIARLKRAGKIKEVNPLENPRAWKFIEPVEELKIIKHD